MSDRHDAQVIVDSIDDPPIATSGTPFTRQFPTQRSSAKSGMIREFLVDECDDNLLDLGWQTTERPNRRAGDLNVVRTHAVDEA
jgi:hypothetical protein